MAYTFKMAGQDITSTVQWLPDPTGGSIPNAQPIQVDTTLGQGAGVGGQSSGRAAQATFLTTLGPAASAAGAGTAPPTTTTNLFSAQQSDIESTSFPNPDFILNNLGAGGSAGRDTAQAWHGSSSLKVVMDGTGGFQSLSVNIAASSFVAGGVYTVSGYLRASAGQTPNLRFFVEGNDGIAGNSSIGSTTTHATPVSTGWTRYAVTITMPNPIPYSYIGLRLDTGGTAQAITFWLDGLQMEASSSTTPWHLGGTSNLQLVRQGEVVITDASTNTIVFGGYVGKLDDATDKKQVYTQVSCYDYWQALARVNINQVFDGVTDIQAITTLISTYAPWVSLSQVPTFASGTLLGQVWRNKTLQWALQKIAKITGRQVWVNPQKQLMYVSPTDANGSPFSLSDTPDMVSTFPHIVDNYSVDDQSIINRVTFYGGKQPTPDFSNDVSTQANGTNKVFVTAYYMRKSTNGKVIVTVNSVSQVVGYSLGTGAQNTLKSAGGDCDCLINPSARTITFDVAPPSGASVICTYRYQLPLIVQVSQPDSIAFFGGTYDGTISDETVVDSATAIQRCRVLLLEQAYGLTSMTLRCWKSGLQTGQLLKVVNTVKGINNTYIIQEIKATPVAPNTIEYEVSLGAWNWNLVDILHLLSARTAGSLDDNEVETVQPTQVEVMATVGVSVVLTPSTTNFTMGLFAPGLTSVAANGEQPAYPGFSSI